MQRLLLKMWLKNVAACCGSITQRAKNGLHFLFILVCCFSFFFMYMLVPTHASGQPVFPDNNDKKYFVTFSYESKYGTSHYTFYSDLPMDFKIENTIYSDTKYLTAYSPDGTVAKVVSYSVFCRFDLDVCNDMNTGTHSRLSFDTSRVNTLSFKNANYDVRLDGDLVFQKPGEEVVPEEWWIVLLNQIAQNALVIVGIVGVSLIALWISLRLLVKLFRIFTTSSSRSRGK